MFRALKYLHSATHKLKDTSLKSCEGYTNWTILTVTKSIKWMILYGITATWYKHGKKF